jgi:hypothetical protein
VVTSRDKLAVVDPGAVHQGHGSPGGPPGTY